jgi:hypothetical protein
MATKIDGPKPKFSTLGKSKYVHVFRTEAWDRKNAECNHVRRKMVAGTIDYKKNKGISPEAAASLDPCEHCDTAGVLKSLLTPAQIKKAGRERTDDTLNKVRDEQKKVSNKRGHNLKSDKSKKPAERMSKPVKQQMVKSGPKSLGDDATKAQILADFAKEHGWKVEITEDKPGVKLVAKRGKETITCWFEGGKYDIGRLGYITVEGSDWKGNLRAAHACRRQMSGEGRDRPHPNPGLGRSAPRSKREEPTPETEESPEDAHKRVPFSIDDDDLTIIDAIKGKTIRWRNGVSGLVEEALLPSKAEGHKRAKMVITTHPKKGRRILSFFPVEEVGEHGEVYGGERNVALDKIVRVVA